MITATVRLAIATAEAAPRTGEFPASAYRLGAGGGGAEGGFATPAGGSPGAGLPAGPAPVGPEVGSGSGLSGIDEDLSGPPHPASATQTIDRANKRRTVLLTTTS